MPASALPRSLERPVVTSSAADPPGAGGVSWPVPAGPGPCHTSDPAGRWSHGCLGTLRDHALRGVTIVLPALPSTAYSLLAGAILGFKTGFLTIAFTDVVACSFAFGLARCWRRGPVRRLVGDKAMSVVERFSSSRLESNFLLITGLLMTGFFDFVSYGLGIAGTSAQRFLPALALSVVVSDLPIVALGAGVFDSGKATLVGAIVGVFLLAFIQSTVRRRFAELKQIQD